MSHQKVNPRELRHQRIRKKIVGTSDRPRLSLYRSTNHLYAQVINDHEGKTLLGVSTQSKDFSDTKNSGNVKGAKSLGKLVAERAIKNNIKNVVFDRGGFLYHGRIKAFAEGAREAGLQF